MSKGPAHTRKVRAQFSEAGSASPGAAAIGAGRDARALTRLPPAFRLRASRLESCPPELEKDVEHPGRFVRKSDNLLRLQVVSAASRLLSLITSA